MRKRFLLQMVWWMNKHKHFINNVSVFRVISFNAFWNFFFFRHGIFWGLHFGPGIFWGRFVWGPRDFFGFWFLPSFDHPCHLKSGVPTRPPLPPYPAWQASALVLGPVHTNAFSKVRVFFITENASIDSRTRFSFHAFSSVHSRTFQTIELHVAT